MAKRKERPWLPLMPLAARNHPFSDGNKRTAWVLARLFLALNGHALKFDSQDAVRTMLALASGELSEAELADSRALGEPLMRRTLYGLAGWLALGLGAVGIVLPGLPTVPFVILAAFLFSRGNPRLEAWLVGHKIYGPHITHWRERGAISRRGKQAALAAFAVSAALGLWLMEMPFALVPLIAAGVGGTWIWTRPE